MFKDIKVHPIHYALLSGWFSLGLILMALARFNPILQMQTLVLMAMGYLVWGTLHHYLLHDLKAKIMLEYVLIAMLAMLLFWGAVSRL